MTPGTHIIDAFPAGRGDDAATLVFEYLAATLAGAGRPAPAGAAELPGVLGRELEGPQADRQGEEHCAAGRRLSPVVC
jgi:hypothetical protein